MANKNNYSFKKRQKDLKRKKKAKEKFERRQSKKNLVTGDGDEQKDSN